MAEYKTKYEVKQAFKVIVPVYKGQGKKKAVTGVKQTETITPGIYNNFSKSVLESKEFEFYKKNGKIRVYREAEIVDENADNTEKEKKSNDSKISAFSDEEESKDTESEENTKKFKKEENVKKSKK